MDQHTVVLIFEQMKLEKAVSIYVLVRVIVDLLTQRSLLVPCSH